VDKMLEKTIVGDMFVEFLTKPPEVGLKRAREVGISLKSEREFLKFKPMTREEAERIRKKIIEKGKLNF